MKRIRFFVLMSMLMAGGHLSVMAQQGNGLPAKVVLPSNWGDVKLVKESFDATEYPGFKIVLREKPESGTVQVFYRNAAQAADYKGTYVTWEPDNADDLASFSEDGLTMYGYFNNDNLEGDNVITEFALQNCTSNGSSARDVTVIIERVYLLDEDDNEIPTSGLKASGWNPATITEVEEVDPNAPVVEKLEIKAQDGAEIASVQSDGNGLPAKVVLPSNWGDVKLVKESFDATTYPGFKIVLSAKPESGTVQVFYRNAAQAADYKGTYVTWEPDNADDLASFSEDGLTMYGYFNNDNLEGDNVITEFALQNCTSNGSSARDVEVTIMHVYLLDEDDNEKISSGLKATGWNPATITELGGEGDKYSADVKWTATGGIVGPYSGTVQENTYHKIVFETSSALPDGFSVVCQDADGHDVDCLVEGQGTAILSVTVRSSYEKLAVQYTEVIGQEMTVHFKSVVRTIYKDGATQVPLVTATKAVEYYNIAGQKVTEPGKGLFLIREVYTNGTVKIRKQLF